MTKVEQQREQPERDAMSNARLIVMLQAISDQKKVHSQRVRKVVKALLQQKVVDKRQAENGEPPARWVDRTKCVANGKWKQQDVAADQNLFRRWSGNDVRQPSQH